jgi:hypothetical protein
MFWNEIATFLFICLKMLFLMFAREHRKNIRESNRAKHEKGQGRKQQKYKDKKRKREEWEQNPNKVKKK